MAFTAPTGPLQEEEIILNSRQKEKVERFKFERVENLTKKWIEFRDQNITDVTRDNLLSQSVLEVEALVSYSKNGSFARYFVYINNELRLYQSINEAIRDPAFINIPWAELTASLLTTNWERFVTFAHLHEQDLRNVAGHIVNVTRSIEAVLNEIISMIKGKIKEIFIDAFEFIKRYALPAAIMTLACTAAVAIPIIGHFGLHLHPCAIIFGVGFVTGALANKGLSMLSKERKEEKDENDEIATVGLRKSRNSISDLLQNIENKKVWDEDNGRAYRPYINYERKISNFMREIDSLIRSN